jgi:ribosomal-protein-alanine N-acetyltransferase
MTAADVPEAAALDRLLFSGECWSAEDFYTSLEDPSRCFWVAYEGETFLGCCGLQQSFEQGDVLTVAVDPACRRRGIGSALLKALIQAFLQRGGASLFLEVRASNEAAIGLYEKHGFRRIGLRRNYYQQPTEDGLIYQLEVHG